MIHQEDGFAIFGKGDKVFPGLGTSWNFSSQALKIQRTLQETPFYQPSRPGRLVQEVVFGIVLELYEKFSNSMHGKTDVGLEFQNAAKTLFGCRRDPLQRVRADQNVVFPLFCRCSRAAARELWQNNWKTACWQARKRCKGSRGVQTTFLQCFDR